MQRGSAADQQWASTPRTAGVSGGQAGGRRHYGCPYSERGRLTQSTGKPQKEGGDRVCAPKMAQHNYFLINICPTVDFGPGASGSGGVPGRAQAPYNNWLVLYWRELYGAMPMPTQPAVPHWVLKAMGA